MNIASVSSRASAGTADVAAPTDDFTSRGDPVIARFAAMLANAVVPQKVEPKALAVEAPLSELDVPAETAVVEEKDAAVTLDANAADATTALSAAVASLGRPAAGLDPVLRVKLARVIERMRDEEGKTVTVTEGVRSQGRQNALFAQGRTTEGPVVTWTRNSQHIKGLAADLQVDGGFTDAGGFDALRRIAREEGLHTLGKIDPGHVELKGGRNAPTGTSLDSIARLATRTDSIASSRQGALDITARGNAALRAIATPLAVVPQVARVAKVATVASVASVALAGVSASTSVAEASSSGTNTSSKQDSRGGETQRPGAPAGFDPMGMDGMVDRAITAYTRPTDARSGSDALQISGPDGSQSAAQVDRVLDIQDARGVRSLSRLNLSVDDGRGGQDTIRIGMRGNSVGASFDIRDAGSADRISARLGELTRSLERHGLEPQTFQVRSPSAEPISAARVGIGASAFASEGAATRSQDQATPRDAGRHQFAHQQEQQERARDRSDDRRRRGGIFSLTQEEA